MLLARSLLASAMLLSLSACAATLEPRAQVTREGEAATTPSPANRPVVAPAAAAGPPANDNLNAVAWMQTSVEFRLASGQTFRSALMQLDKAIKTPSWDALPASERENPALGLPTAIIVDIDETMLDNTPYQARLVRDDASFKGDTWDAWVHERAARPMPGALEFAKAAAAREVTIYYVSNRTVAQGAATLENLRKAGFPVKDDSQFLGAGTKVESCETAKDNDKGCRRRLIGRTHRVLMLIGDQLGDFTDVATNTPQGREQAVRPYLGWIGERWFMLPNPSYGSWESALYGEAPPAERRARKRAALRY